MIDEKYIVRDEDKNVICILNESLVRKQHITEMGIVSLKILHQERHRYIKGMAETDVSQREVLQWFVRKIKEADFALQQAWGFPQDENYHRWWEVPHCLCPHLDNAENYGTQYRIINGQCPVHGGEHETNTPV